MTRPKTITVGELRLLLLNELNQAPDHAEVFFGAGDLTLYRLKNRGAVGGPGLYQIELNELYTITHTPDSADAPSG
ncbi:MAG: hypothetical protein AMXMBFR78_11420 [Rubrivivax sp.]|jgi:hypothetical protein